MYKFDLPEELCINIWHARCADSSYDDTVSPSFAEWVILHYPFIVTLDVDVTTRIPKITVELEKESDKLMFYLKHQHSRVIESPIDAGMFYCPYIPLQFSSTQSSTCTYTVKFITRYK